ncbi:MAG: AMP-binding protein [Rhodospirillales bacterium]
MSSGSPEFCDVTVHDTFPKVLAYNAANWPTEIAMREKDYGIWIEYSWSDYNEAVKQIAMGLKALGFERGQVVGMIGDNRPEWVQFEIAGHALGGLSIGIYRDCMGDEAEYLINYAEIAMIMAEDEEQVDKLLDLGDRIPTVRRIIYDDTRGMEKYDDPRLMKLTELKRLGAERIAANADEYDREVALGKGEDVAVLCTTSGTTSRPKLAMLQGGPFLGHCLAYLEKDPKLPTDNYCAVLPLPWIMEQVYAIGHSLVCRNIVNFVEETDTMMADMREIAPNFVLLAPRTWEALVADVKARMMDASSLKQRLFDWGVARGMKAFEEGRRDWLTDFLIFNPLRDRLGLGKVTSAATGGAALGPETFKFFLAMGVPLRQLYGQTELAGAYTLHEPDDVDFDTVGVPFDNTEIRIDNPDPEGVGEIVTKNGGMFLGFYKNPEATAADVRDGWMHTGDAGYIRPKDGHLVVIDRIADLAETNQGTRFSPQFIENKLKFSPYVGEAVILGNKRDYLSAIICIRFDIMAKWAEHNAVSFTNYTNLSARPEIYGMIENEVRGVNATLPPAQRIRKFLLLYKELDADDGELTRTRKVRRGVINERYADIINTLYSDKDSVHVDTEITFPDGTRSRIVTDLRVIDLGADGGAGEEEMRKSA